MQGIRDKAQSGKQGTSAKAEVEKNKRPGQSQDSRVKEYPKNKRNVSSQSKGQVGNMSGKKLFLEGGE